MSKDVTCPCDGELITRADLPPAKEQRWTIRRKARVLALIKGGLVSEDEVLAMYSMHPDELESWRRDINRFGPAGLRVTHIQRYGDRPVRDPDANANVQRLKTLA